MAYNDEALKAKLSTLNETQDSIVSVSQWITFHKRHADRIAAYWLTRLRDAPPPKRLNFIYLVNDIVQNARARKRPEFPDAFSPLMPEAVVTAYRSSTPEIQNKIRRVVEVWKTRSVWEQGIQAAIEARLQEVDVTKSSSGKKTLGGSLFNSSSTSSNGKGGGVPNELSTLPPLQIAVTKATLTASPAVTTANSEYNKVNDPNAEVPRLPVQAARLSSLIKALVTAESSLNSTIEARKALIADLERILTTAKEALGEDDAALADLTAKRTETETKKRDVEDGIMRGLPAESSVEGFDPTHDSGDRPEVEELTPEPEDSFTPPPALSGPDNQGDSFTISSTSQDTQPQFSSNPQLQGLLAGFSSGGSQSPPAFNADIGSPHTNLLAGRVRQASGSVEPSVQGHSPTHAGATYASNGHSVKRRKTSHGADDAMVPDLGEMGMDMNEFAASGGGGAAPSQQHDVLGSLEGDVDELIRSQGIA